MEGALHVSGGLVTTGSGTTCRLHQTGNRKGFVYALGHRVYGHLDVAYNHQVARTVVVGFRPHGKWAFTITGVLNAAPQVAANA